MLRRNDLFVVLVAAPLLASACGTPRQRETGEDRVAGEVGAALRALGNARIFFAHQSVGGNIVDGMKSVQQVVGSTAMNIVDLEGVPSSAPFFAHARLGENGDPKGKTSAFLTTIESGLGNRLDLALQKYCFADIDATTDVQKLFDNYKASMLRLHAEFPRLTVAHVTAPIVRVQSGPKAFIKLTLGRAPDHYEDNIARERFNDLMRREYQGREPLFDVAALEASRLDSPPDAIAFGGAKVHGLRPEYTDDGAHLNEEAQKRVASAFILFLQRTVAGAAHGKPTVSE
jgi:hypothetical protein